MSFSHITQGSKNYIKYVLDLNEAKSVSQGTSPGLNAGNTAGNPTMPNKLRTGTPSGVNPSTSGNGYGSAGKGAGSGGLGTLQPRDEILNPILMGAAARIPGRRVYGQISQNAPQTASTAQDTINYMTNIAQGSSIADNLDANLPASVKLALGASLVGKRMDVKGGPVGNLSNIITNAVMSSPGGTGGANTGIANAAQGLQKNLSSMTTKGDPQYNPLFAKFAQYHLGSSTFDPSNPLGALKDVFTAFGGRAIRRNMGNIGTSQQRGAETSMGHPSGYGYF